jgi:hypothetical protein
MTAALARNLKVDHSPLGGPISARLLGGGLLREAGLAQLILDKGGEGARFCAGAAARWEYRPQIQRWWAPSR